MNAEEKLEQSSIVKGRGTAYFKVSTQQEPGDTPRGPAPRRPACPRD